MNNFFKIISCTIIIIFFNSCAYEPVLKKQNYNFSINFVELNGDQKVISLITNNLNRLNNQNGTKYDVYLNVNQERKILSKDSKGDPSKFELVISVLFKVKNNNKIIIDKKIVRRDSYNNIVDKFDLENFENILFKNLSDNIAESIISHIANISE